MSFKLKRTISRTWKKLLMKSNYSTKMNKFHLLSEKFLFRTIFRKPKSFLRPLKRRKSKKSKWFRKNANISKIWWAIWRHSYIFDLAPTSIWKTMIDAANHFYVFLKNNKQNDQKQINEFRKIPNGFNCLISQWVTGKWNHQMAQVHVWRCCQTHSWFISTGQPFLLQRQEQRVFDRERIISGFYHFGYRFPTNKFITILQIWLNNLIWHQRYANILIGI